MSIQPHDSSTQTALSLGQATAMLPLLRLIVADISLAHRDLTERRSQLHRIKRSREHRSAAVDGFFLGELLESEADLAREQEQLDALVGELEGLGVVLQNARDGVVLFPTLMSDSPAYFCWKMGDLEIESWIRPGETFADRRLIVP